jgi:RNA polymerase sigma-B factor
MTATARRDPDPAQISEWFREYRTSGDRALRNRLVEAHLHLADYHVTRFSRGAGVAADDLRQTAFLAVLRAVERFDPDKGVAFATFASRTIDGELKRHLRDRTWSVRPPRRAQELHLRLRSVGEELSHRLGRAPTVDELADAADATTEQVLEALEAGQARSATPIDAPGPSGDAESSLSRVLGALDAGLEGVETRHELHAALASLDRRERLVLHLRFVEELSQPEIADRIGVSQSYVSRMLRSSLATLKGELSDA